MGAAEARQEPPFTIPVKEIGGYEVVASLAKGAYGEVLHVKDKQDNDYALKQILCYSKEEVTTASHEAVLLKLLAHPTVVKFKEVKQLHYKSRYAVIIVMEYINGMNLRQFLQEKEGHIDTMDVMKWFITLLEGLVHIHAHHVVHRDLKPANILIDKDGKLKIADFGISKIILDKSARTTAGTLTYMAPELLRQKGNCYDGKADVWSLGCILYEVATGTNLKEIMYVKLNNDPELLSKISNYSIRVILQHMLEIDAAKRYTAEQLLESDVVKGWKALLDHSNTKDISPPSTHYLLPYISSLGVGSITLRSNAIQYLSTFLKLSQVHKYVIDKGLKPLLEALEPCEDPAQVPKSDQDRVSQIYASNLLILEFLSSACNRVLYGRRCAFQLLHHGGAQKLLACCRSSLSNSSLAAPILDRVLSLLVRYEELYYALCREEGLDYVLSCWLQSGHGPRMAAALSIFIDIPYYQQGEDEALNTWTKITAAKGTPAKSLSLLMRMTRHRKYPHELVNEETERALQTIIHRGITDPTMEAGTLEGLLIMLRPWRPWFVQASLLGECTSVTTGKSHASQYFFRCKTCWPKDQAKGCCLTCVSSCHRGHKLKYIPPNTSYCDCKLDGMCKLSGSSVPGILSCQLVSPSALHRTVVVDLDLSIKRQGGDTEVKVVRSGGGVFQPIGFDLSQRTGDRTATAFYFETSIVQGVQDVYGIGISPLQEGQKQHIPGMTENSWGYHSDDGCKIARVPATKSVYGPTFSTGDVIGCGVTWGGSIYFTINGYYLGIAFSEVLPLSKAFYATVGIARRGTGQIMISVRTQAPFLFHHEKLHAELLNLSPPAYNRRCLRLLTGDGPWEKSMILQRLFACTENPDVLAHTLFVLAHEDFEQARTVLNQYGSVLERTNTPITQSVIEMLHGGTLAYTFRRVGTSGQASGRDKGKEKEQEFDEGVPSEDHFKKDERKDKLKNLHSESLEESESESLMDEPIALPINDLRRSFRPRNRFEQPNDEPVLYSVAAGTFAVIHPSPDEYTPGTVGPGIASAPSKLRKNSKEEASTSIKPAPEVVTKPSLKTNLQTPSGNEQNDKQVIAELVMRLLSEGRYNSNDSTGRYRSLGRTESALPISVRPSHLDELREALLPPGGRTLKEVKEAFWQVWDDLPPTDIIKIEKVVENKGTTLRLDASVAVLQPHTVLVFYLKDS